MLTLLLLAACPKAVPVAPPADPTVPVASIVTFDGRKVDLAAHLDGFPYESVLAIPEKGILLYDHTGSTRTMMRTRLDHAAAPDLAKDGTAISTVDWDARSRWDLRYVPAADAVYFNGDATNDEVLNVWKLSLADGALIQLTTEQYTYGFGISPDETTLATIARRGDGPYTSCLRTMALDGTNAKDVLCDTPSATFTWSEVSFSPDGKTVVVAVNVDGRRDRANLAAIELANPKITLLLDPAPARFDANAARYWLDADRIAYWTDESGFDQVWAYDVHKGTKDQLGALDREVADLRVLGEAGAKRVIATTTRPDGDRIVVLDPKTKKELGSVDVAGTVSVVGDDRKGALVLAIDGPSTPIALRWLTIDAAGVPTVAPWLDVPAPLAEKLVSCDVQKVQVPTWDSDPATGKTRLLHAYLYTPTQKPAPERALARITAFYGGEDTWDTETQVFCDAGIATLSPAVRGSTGFGAAFFALNDKDLGGNEIADLFAAGRWLETQGYARGHIGVYGGSHGGYATMRALTFPPGTDGHTDDIYPFAFGLAHAGFSDILTFYAATNIPDWVELEAGDPKTDEAKIRDRSPLSHVDLLNAPLFLSHGENDNRVPVAESRQMAAACKAAGKNCTYLEFPGQGHHINGRDKLVELYQGRLTFLEQVLAN
jgi:dipeptidyl aminopeptidase/acylaminoacyl peptidase